MAYVRGMCVKQMTKWERNHSYGMSAAGKILASSVAQLQENEALYFLASSVTLFSK